MAQKVMIELMLMILVNRASKVTAVKFLEMMMTVLLRMRLLSSAK